MVSYKRIGGLRFLRIGRLNIQWSIAKVKPSEQLGLLESLAAHWRGFAS